jgi:hypothetical protein
MLEHINILCSTNMRSEKIKDKDLGLPLTIFVQAFPQRFKEQKKKNYLRDLLTYALLYCCIDGVHKMYIYKLGQGPSNMVTTILFLPSRKQYY